MQGQLMEGTKGATFPYSLADLLYWVIKRKDGTVVKFVLAEGARPQGTGTIVNHSVRTASASARVFAAHEWCHHFPVNPVYVNDKLKLYIADDIGVRKDGPKFDIVIDCGDVVKFSNKDFFQEGIFSGDSDFASKFTKFQIGQPSLPRVLKINWWDRCEPELSPEFWPALAPDLGGRVVINCQGGHGRSGTAIVCLLMCYIPSYTPLDAFIHLRAVHCPRAIESTAQHKYINEVGIALGREGNMPALGNVHNYKEAFEQSKNKDAQRIRKLLDSLKSS